MQGALNDPEVVNHEILHFIEKGKDHEAEVEVIQQNFRGPRNQLFCKKFPQGCSIVHVYNLARVIVPLKDKSGVDDIIVEKQPY